MLSLMRFDTASFFFCFFFFGYGLEQAFPTHPAILLLRLCFRLLAAAFQNTEAAFQKLWSDVNDVAY